jgi:threonine dehydratase
LKTLDFFIILPVFYLQGTIGLEFMEQVPDLDAILVTVGGGGLISGVAIASKHIKPTIKGNGQRRVQLQQSQAEGAHF